MKSPNDVRENALPDGMVIPSHGRGRLKPFLPGNRANPKGLGGTYPEVLALAREASPAAMRKLIKLIDHRSPKVALVAAKEVIERAWGKVKEMDPNAGIDPEAAARRAEMRSQVIAMLQALAVPEPLTIEVTSDNEK